MVFLDFFELPPRLGCLLWMETDFAESPPRYDRVLWISE